MLLVELWPYGVSIGWGTSHYKVRKCGVKFYYTIDCRPEFTCYIYMGPVCNWPRNISLRLSKIGVARGVDGVGYSNATYLRNALMIFVMISCHANNCQTHHIVPESN